MVRQLIVYRLRLERFLRLLRLLRMDQIALSLAPSAVVNEKCRNAEPGTPLSQMPLCGGGLSRAERGRRNSD
jgi:hypothetical protein